jgi:outer membrane protein assembly factor BamB
MKNLKLLLALFFQSILLNAFSQTQTNMFRGTALHTSAITSNDKIVFGEKAWTFNADAPIRATTVCNNTTIFFGSSKGIFYALDKNNSTIKWQYNTGYAIESSAALFNGNVFFSDNKQTLYALNASTGKLVWKFDFGTNLNYDWGFDYYYSSPSIADGKILIGAKDGFVYNINALNGKVIWKFKTDGIVRSTPAIENNDVYFGDVEGNLYKVDFNSGKEIWRFKTTGNGLKNEDFGFDRRSIISSPVIAQNKILVGCRDGFLYAVDKKSGKEIWNIDHHVSWVISSVAVKDSIVVTGTSDGRFIQAINLNTGKEIWKFKTVSIVWSSPIIFNDNVYIGSQEGILYCLDLHTGKKITSFQANGKIFSSPVVSDTLLYFGTDKGLMYSLKPSKNIFPSNDFKKYVFWQNVADPYFHYGNSERIKIYLTAHGYEIADTSSLINILSETDSAAHSVIVFANNFFPKNITKGNEHSLLRNYLQAGGRIVVLGINPAIYEFDSTGNLSNYNFSLADSLLNIHYGSNDLRSMSGIQPAFATDEGKHWGVENSFTAFLPTNEKQIDVVLGKDENGKPVAWIKRYNADKNSGLVQLWIDPDFIDDMSSIINVAEHAIF